MNLLLINVCAKKLLLKAIVLHMAIINSQVAWSRGTQTTTKTEITDIQSIRSTCVIFTNRKQIPQWKEEKCISHEFYTDLTE